MSTIIDSEAAFQQRCSESASDATLHAKLSAQGIKTFKTLAFVIGSPQQPPTESQFEAFSAKVYGAEPTMGQTAVLRHLHFEATTLVVQTYRDLVTHDPSDPSHTRKVPVPEKRARLDLQRRRLSGMEITGELEPSHQLLDMTNQQYESGIIMWIPASKCAKREAEILATGKDKGSLLQVEQNVIKVGQGEPHIACDVTDPLRFQWAMMRRGLAYDSCHMISWDVHQKWVQKMLDCLSMTPPPGYSAVTLNQCMRADKELFLLLAREVVPPFKVDSLGVSPLDSKFQALMYDVRLQQYLLHGLWTCPLLFCGLKNLPKNAFVLLQQYFEHFSFMPCQLACSCMGTDQSASLASLDQAMQRDASRFRFCPPLEAPVSSF